MHVSYFGKVTYINDHCFNKYFYTMCISDRGNSKIKFLPTVNIGNPKGSFEKLGFLGIIV